jgi:VWFA-related protein
LLLQVVIACIVLRSAEGSQTDNTFTISDNVDRVLLDVSVTDRAGRYVTGLGRSAFHVWEDGRARQITDFDAGDAPVTVGLILDSSGSTRLKRPEVIMAGLAFARESNPRDQFFVVNFADSVNPGLPVTMPFTDKLQVLRSALYMGEASGKTSLYDAIAYGLGHLQLSSLERRTLIVVSDGGDNASKASLSEVMHLVAASRATIYTVGLLDRDDPDLRPGVLRKLATVTGGEFFEPERLTDVMPVFKQICTDIRRRYTLGYVPDEVNNSSVFRNVKVTAQENGRKLKIRTRKEYSIARASESSAEQLEVIGRDGR